MTSKKKVEKAVNFISTVSLSDFGFRFPAYPSQASVMKE